MMKGSQNGVAVVALGVSLDSIILPARLVLDSRQELY
jgi:hypothetical protein